MSRPTWEGLWAEGSLSILGGGGTGPPPLSLLRAGELCRPSSLCPQPRRKVGPQASSSLSPGGSVLQWVWGAGP